VQTASGSLSACHFHEEVPAEFQRVTIRQESGS
jgi:hypothetical protein